MINAPQQQAVKLRVAAYIRVSTALDIQENSFETQERYFTDYIRSHPEWRMVGIYSDYALSGTCKEKRHGFQRLLRHCEEGKIDRILCKSLSRFARNTLDALEAVRKLKKLGISVYFEKENLDSATLQSEFVLSTIAAIAQEESRSISENLRIAYKQRSENGKLNMCRVLGYHVSRKTKNKKQLVTVDPDEAETVRGIYDSFLKGRTMIKIADDLISQGRPNRYGEVVWSSGSVRAVLVNEKYTGDLLTQKTFTPDYLTHQIKVNNGERIQHLIRDHHPAIIDRETWEKAQERLISHENWSKRNVRYAFSKRIHCACGGNYQRSNGQSRFKWVCGNSKKSMRLCDAAGIFEDELVEELKAAFLRKYGEGGELDIRKLLIGLKTVQDLDNVENQRVVMKRRIAAEEDGAKKLVLEEELKRLECLWILLEEDRNFRSGAIEWLKDMSDRRASTAQLLEILDATLLRAWFVEGTIKGNMLTSHWLDGSETETELRRSQNEQSTNKSRGDS